MNIPIFFVKNPARRVVGELVGHIGILKKQDDSLFLIHASGSKGRGGKVKKVEFSNYLHENSFFFPYILVTRF